MEYVYFDFEKIVFKFKTFILIRLNAQVSELDLMQMNELNFVLLLLVLSYFVLLLYFLYLKSTNIHVKFKVICALIWIFK